MMELCRRCKGTGYEPAYQSSMEALVWAGLIAAVSLSWLVVGIGIGHYVW